jgi:predicted HTH transcriptional regulator
MTQIILIIVGVVIALLLLSRKTRERAVGICAIALDQMVRKNANKEKTLAFIQERKEASNEEIREYLGVSRRSVVRYLDALEKEGRVEQVGTIGRSVIYRVKSHKVA